MPVTAVRGLPLPAAVSSPAFATSISANNRYLLDQFGQPYMINADSVWAAAYAINSTDQTTYLADRQANGFNSIVSSLIGNGTLGLAANGQNWNGELPFVGGNLANPNSVYWARIDTFINLCATYGITLFADPMDAYTTHTDGPMNGVTGPQAQAFGAFLAARYPKSSYKNIVWFFGNDWDYATPTPAVYESLLTGLQSTGDIRPIITEGNANGPNNAADIPASPFASAQTTNGCYTEFVTYDCMLTAYAALTLPTILIEAPYENSTVVPGFTTLNVRQAMCWPMTCGATGSFYGNDSLWRFTAGWQAQLDTTPVAQRKLLNAAFASIAWWKLVPDTGNVLVTAGRGSQSTGESTLGTWSSSFNHYVTAAVSADGKVAAIYNPDSSQNTITLSSAPLAANPIIKKIDPANGSTTTSAFTTNPTGGANSAGDHDWLYLISAG